MINSSYCSNFFATEIPLLNIEIPVLRINTGVIVECTIEYSKMDSTGQRNGRFYLESTMLTSNNVTATQTSTVPYRFGFLNQGNVAAQRGIVGLNGNGYLSSTEPPATAAVNTGIEGRFVSIRTMSNIPGITARVGEYELIIRS